MAFLATTQNERAVYLYLKKNAYTRSVWYGMRMFGEKPSLKTSNYVHINAIQNIEGPLNTP